jgi:hypothetical protein
MNELIGKNVKCKISGRIGRVSGVAIYEYEAAQAFVLFACETKREWVELNSVVVID